MAKISDLFKNRTNINIKRLINHIKMEPLTKMLSLIINRQNIIKMAIKELTKKEKSINLFIRLKMNFMLKNNMKKIYMSGKKK